jgi:hypothetical protein
MRKNQVIAIIVLLAVIGLVVWYGKKPAEPQSTNGTVERRDPETPEGSSATNFNTISREDWEFTAQAEKDLAIYLQDKGGIDVIIQDPVQPNVYYFTTQNEKVGKLDCGSQNFFSVYRYDSTTYRFARLFKNIYTMESEFGVLSPFSEEAAVPAFWLQGVDHGELIFDISPCYSPRVTCLDPSEMLWSLSINNPYDGFRKYSDPEGVRIVQQRYLKEKKTINCELPNPN